MFEELAGRRGDDLDHARERAQRHADDIGTGFRIAGEGEERPWPLSPVPLLIAERRMGRDRRRASSSAPS